MQYHQRRPEKAITDRDQLLTVLREGNVVTLAMCRNDEPYLVTVNYALNEAGTAIYFHCAGQGKKFDYLSANPKVWGQVFIDGGYLEGECDHRFRTVQFAAEAAFVKEESAKREALTLMIRHFEPNPEPVIKRFLGSPEAVSDVAVVRLDLLQITGKESHMSK